jgi:exopolysaccharide production protein ExoQ
VNWISIPLVQVAVHLPGEIDPGLVGNWRGLYEHKNVAGGICAMTVLLFLFTRTGRGNWIGLGVAAGAIAFLVETHSKSSEGFLPVAWFAGTVYRLSWRNGLDRAIVVTLSLLGITALGAFAFLNADALSRVLSDPAEFTGRAAVWQAEFAFIRDHPLLGAGFGTFSETGGPSILHNYVRGWVTAASHGHNGYLQLIVTLGITGFLLTMLGFVIGPAVQFWRLNTGIVSFKPLLFSLFVFVVLHNFMETDYLEADGPVWVLFLIAIASLRELHRVERWLPAYVFPKI